MNKELLEQKLQLVKAEMGEFTCEAWEFIDFGCEKDVFIRTIKQLPRKPDFQKGYKRFFEQRS